MSRGLAPPQHGVTLIELVILLVLIAIGASAVSSLLVGGLNINETNRRFAEDVRQATSCYETILAIHEVDRDGYPSNAEWQINAEGQQAIIEDVDTCSGSSCPSDWSRVKADDVAGDWIERSSVRTLFTDACKKVNLPSPEDGNNLKIRSTVVAGGPAVQFHVPVRGGRGFEVVLPVRPASGGGPSGNREEG